MSALTRHTTFVGLLVLAAAALMAALALGVADARAEVDTNGGYQHSVAIEVPPFHGLEPRVALSYSANRGNDVAGVGWTLEATSYVVREGANGGAPAHDSTDTYVLDGVKLVPCASTGGSPSCANGIGTHTTEVESFRRIRKETADWEIWEKDGTHATYKPQLVWYPGQPYRWALARIEDTHGNAVVYDYTCHAAGECYVDRIAYERPAGPLGTWIKVYYESRADPYSYAAGASLVRVQRRLKSIAVHAAGSLLRAYALEYNDVDPNTGKPKDTTLQPHSMLGVAEYGRDAAVDPAGNVTPGASPHLPRQTFSTKAAGGGWSVASSLASFVLPWPNNGGVPGTGNLSSDTGIRWEAAHGPRIRFFAGDVDADERHDVISTHAEKDGVGVDRVHLRVAKTDRDGMYTIRTQLTQWPYGSHSDPEWRLVPGDVNGDGRTDVVAAVWNTATRTIDLHTAFARANQQTQIFDLAATPQSTTIAEWDPRARFLGGDVNGDRKADIMVALRRKGSPDRTNLLVALSKGNGAFEVRPIQQAPWEFLAQDDAHWFAGDANKDGQADFMRVIQKEPPPGIVGIQPTATFQTGLSNGDGTFTLVEQNTGISWHSADYFPDYTMLGDVGSDLVQLGDFNADGRSDLLFMQNVFEADQKTGQPIASTGRIKFWTGLSRGDGTYSVVQQDTGRPGTPGHVSIEYSNWMWSWNATDDLPNQWTSGDFDGDDASDLGILAPATWDRTKWPTETRIVRLISNRDGTFKLIPSTSTGWTHDCWRRGNVCPDGPSFVAFSADADGDGTADIVRASYLNDAFGERTSLRVARHRFSGNDPERWLSADFTGDGLNDRVYVHYSNPGLRVYTLLGRGADSSGYGTVATQDVLPGFDDPNMRLWRAADVGSPGGGPDGNADLVGVYYREDPAGAANGIYVYTLISNGDGTWLARPGPNGAFAYPQLLYEDAWSWRLMDVDANGLFDLVHTSHDGTDLAVTTLFSRGDGTWNRVTTRPLAGTGPTDAPNWIDLDQNGDNLADLVHVDSDGAANQLVRTLLSRGDGYWTPRTELSTMVVPDTGDWRRAELNGDNKADLVNTGGLSGVRVDMLLSRGNGGWTPDVATPASTFASAATRTLRVLDVNDDGLDDLARADAVNVELILNGHDAWKTDRRAHGIASHIGYQINEILGWRTEDDDADGSDDLFVAAHSANAARFVSLRSKWPDRRLTAHANGLGTSTTILYRASSGTHAYVPPGLNLRLVQRTETAVAGMGTTVVDYTYEGGRWSNREGRFLGFGKIVESDGTSRIVTEYRQTPACSGQPTLSLVTEPGGKTLTSSRFLYRDTSKTGTLPYRCLIEHRYDEECEGTQQCRVASTFFDHDLYGNVTREEQHGEFVDTDGDSRDDRTGDNRARVWSYSPNTSKYVVGLPATEEVYDEGAGSKRVSRKDYLYDTNSSSSQPPTVGDLTAEDVWNDQTGATKRSQYAYDSHGNLERVTHPSGRWSSIEYDPTYEMYPVKRCNALKICSEQTWDYTLGKPKTDIDANQATTSYAYDSFGRLKRVDFADGGCIAYSYVDVGTVGAQRIREAFCDRANADDGALNLGRVRYFDGQGRFWKVDRSGGYEMRMTYRGATHDVESATNWFVPGQKPTAEGLSYDAAGRVTAMHHADGSSARIRYDVGSETHVDELGNEKVLFRDAHARVVRVREKVTEQGTLVDHDTTYAYDALDRLTTVVDAAGNRTTTLWNSLGNKLESCDPDVGCWQYGYDDDGRVEWQIDARGQKIGFVYDAAGRLETKEYYAGGSVQKRATFQYDVDPATGQPRGASRGRLTRVDDPTKAGSEQYVYDSMGRIEQVEKCVGSDCLRWETSHDVLGRIERIDYPDGETVDHLYDTAGRLKSVGAYATRIHYDSDDKVTQIEYGNGATETFDYHPTRHWLAGSTVAVGTSHELELNYHYDAAARLRRLEVANPSPSALTLDYDELGRLLMVGGAQQRELRYDALGNITHNSAVGDYTYTDPGHAHAVTGVSGTGKSSFSYDANGNLLADAIRSLTWDEDNLPSEIVTSGATTTFAYDALGRRVEKSGATGTMRYFGPLVERDARGDLVKKYYAGSTLIARQDSSGVSYLHADLIGSNRLVTDASGNAAARYDYEPFGGVTGTKGSTPVVDLGFAGHRADDETGLVYMNARYYDPVLARFISADTLVPDVLNPQALNRYSYAYNDPFGYIDPSGHENLGVRKTYSKGSQFRLDVRFDLDVTPPGGGSQPLSPTALAYKYSQNVWLAKHASRRPQQMNDLHTQELKRRIVHGGKFEPSHQLHPVTQQPKLYERVMTSKDVIDAAMYTTNASLAAFGGAVLVEGGLVAGAGMALDKGVAGLAAAATKSGATLATGVAMLNTAGIWLYTRSPQLWNALLAAGRAISGLPGAKPYAQVQLNRFAGNAWRDQLATFFRGLGYHVETEVFVRTPFGRRFLDLAIYQSGKLLGYIEAKTGGSRYLASQRAKDFWIWLSTGGPTGGKWVDVVRQPRGP